MLLCIVIQFCDSTHPGKRSTAADCLSRLEADPRETNVQKIRGDITIKPIEVSIKLTAIAFEEPVFNSHDDVTEVYEHEF